MKSPLPLFDDINNIKENEHVLQSFDHDYKKNDYLLSLKFLSCYIGSVGTFNSYRREVEKLIHWSWIFAKKSVSELNREDIEQYIKFCQNPPKSWIGVKKAPRFIGGMAARIPNKEWRPFLAKVSKSEFKDGARAEISDFSISNGSIKEIFAILGSYFNFLIQEEYITSNPILLIRQKSKFLVKTQGSAPVRRLSELQWEHVINIARKMAEITPETGERTLFIMCCLYGMYLRISELVASKRWSPSMNHFRKDHEENWWFTTIGKGNKQRQIAVSDSMLESLKRWRKYLGMSDLPSISDQSPLLPKIRGRGAITSTNYIRRLVQSCFDEAIYNLEQSGNKYDSDSLKDATVHWLRHTGISEDVKIRPREHVRDDAGHSSSATTDRYIDIELRERHKSAKKKMIISDN